MRARPAFLSLATIVALWIGGLSSCHPTAPPSASVAAGAPTASNTPPAAQPKPTTVEEAERLQASGSSWNNEEIRDHYNALVSTIGPADAQWQREGLPVEERARRAFEIRHRARLTCRAMMTRRAEVEELRARDRAKYGNPDGPTFDQLVESARRDGATGDAIYERIIASAQRTNEAVNADGVRAAQ